MRIFLLEFNHMPAFAVIATHHVKPALRVVTITVNSPMTDVLTSARIFCCTDSLSSSDTVLERSKPSNYLGTVTFLYKASSEIHRGDVQNMCEAEREIVAPAAMMPTVRRATRSTPRGRN